MILEEDPCFYSYYSINDSDPNTIHLFYRVVFFLSRCSPLRRLSISGFSSYWVIFCKASSKGIRKSRYVLMQSKVQVCYHALDSIHKIVAHDHFEVIGSSASHRRPSTLSCYYSVQDSLIWKAGNLKGCLGLPCLMKIVSHQFIPH